MPSFEELGVRPELVEALAAEGVEVPSAFQESAMPVLLRGNSLLAQAGPGAGTLLAYGVPILQAIDPEARGARGLILTPSSERALGLAESLARLAQVTGHRVAALGSPWALSELAAILVTTPEDILREVRASALRMDQVSTVVVDGFGGFLPSAREAMETLFEILPREGQRVVLAQPFTPEAEAFGKAHTSRAVHLPPKAAGDGVEEASTRRGEVSYRVTGDAKEMALLQIVAGALEGGARHVLIFFDSEDQAADMADFLALHGYYSGAPGDPDFPLWLGVNELAARKTVDAWTKEEPPPVTVSLEVPADPDSLDRRHGGLDGGLILVRSRELPHLKDVARRTGYRLVPAKEPLPTRVAGELDRIRGLIERTLQEEELAPHYLALEPLYGKYSPGEVAAAILALLRQRRTGGKGEEATAATRAEEESRPAAPPPKTWVRLFVSVGEKEDIGPGDLLGAIAGEAGVEGSQVGKIEIRETFSLVEVTSGVADQVVRGVNGTTIRGRSVRVDYDRGGPSGRGGSGSRGARPQGRGGGATGRSGDGPKRRLKGKPPGGT